MVIKHGESQKEKNLFHLLQPLIKAINKKEGTEKTGETGQVLDHRGFVAVGEFNRDRRTVRSRQAGHSDSNGQRRGLKTQRRQ